MDGAVQESKGGALGDGGQTGEQQASNQAASPERVEVEQQKPERGLTFKLRGAPLAARPLERSVRLFTHQKYFLPGAWQMKGTAPRIGVRPRRSVGPQTAETMRGHVYRCLREF